MTTNILWLASWYPNTLTPFDGDFIQRHARAVSLYNKITVIHLQKDIEGLITKNVKKIISSTHDLKEIIILYHPFRTGILFIDKIISARKYKKTYRIVLKKFISENGAPKLIHVQVAMKAGLQAMYLKLKKKIPYLLTEHWSGYYKIAPQNIYNSGWLKRILTKAILKNASIILPVANSLEQAIKKIENVKCHIIPNVVDTNVFFYNPVQNEKFRFIHPSSMNYAKNPEGIIRAAKSLADEGFQFELMMIGNDKEDLKKIAEDKGLPGTCIFFKGEMTYENVAIEMQSSSALILFSRYESLPCVILEALCCGLPVVSSNVGGINEVVNESNGLLVESENEYQLKEAMKKMIIDYTTYNRKSIADNAKNKFSYEVVGRQIADLYKPYLQH